MPKSPARRDLSLKSLEIFQICALKGSLQAVSDETGLSISTISYHLRTLEEHLGVRLLDHNRRPMILTQIGHAFIRNIDDALHTLRRARAEASSGNIDQASHVRIGTVEDIESGDIGPNLAVHLSQKMPQCHFLYQTDTSHRIIKMLRDRALDLGIVATSSERLLDLRDRPLLRDPFVMIVPKSGDHDPAELFQGKGTLPFLRFASNQFIAKQIDSQLRRLGVTLRNVFECGNSQTLLAMVAAGKGWTITTPLLFFHGRRFQSQLRMHKFPGKSFARTLTIAATPDCSRSVADLVDSKMRTLLSENVLCVTHAQIPWLADSFALID